MALNGNLSVSLRYSLLIALLILIIHALSSDYGVNGEDNDPPKPADNGVIGAKALDSAQDANQVQKRIGKRKRTTKASLSPLGSVSVIPGVDEPKHLPGAPKGVPQSPQSPRDNDASSHRMGATGTQKARQAAEGSKVLKEDSEGDKETKEEIGGAKAGAEKADKTKPQTGQGKQPAGLSEMSYEGEDEEQDTAEILLNPSGTMFATNKDENLMRKKPVTDDVSSAGSFMTYFVVIAIVVIIGYLILHNKKKLMAYIVEGRNTAGRARRQRPTSGSGNEYKPLKNAEEVLPGVRSEEA